MGGKNFDRRGFLKGLLGSGLVGTAFSVGLIDRVEAKDLIGLKSNSRNKSHDFPSALQQYPQVRGDKKTEKFWRNVSEAFALPDDYIHMNTGTTGSQPLFSLNNLIVYNLYKSMDPRDWQINLNTDFPDLFPMINNSAMTARQTAIANQYGANADEIVLSYNTTDACNLIFSGTPWKPGDRIVTTHWEHNAMVGPMVWARDYFGVEVVIVRMPSNFTSDITKAEVLSYFEDELQKSLPAGAKQYLAVSEVFYKNGLRMPIKELCQLAQKYGAYTIVDSAHGWGHLPVNCHDYGVDFLCGAGHKWLCGGPGTGIFYIRKSSGSAPLPPFAMGNFVGYGNLFVKPSANFNSRAWSPAASIQNRGETNTPALYAMTDSATYFDYLGVQDLYDRGVALGDYLKDKIAERWGPEALWVQKNADPCFATALTSFNPFMGKDDSSQFKAINTAMSTVLNTLASETPKIYLRTVTWRDQVTDTADTRVGFRVATHPMYNNYNHIDYMFERLKAAVDATGLPQI